jgi:hypothetical protein
LRSCVAVAVPPLRGIQNGKGWSFLLAKLGGLPAVTCRKYPVTEVYQPLPHHLPDGVVILGKQNGFRALQLGGVGPFPAFGLQFWFRAVSVANRQVHSKQAALPGLAVNVDEPAMLFHDSIRSRQPHPGASTPLRCYKGQLQGPPSISTAGAQDNPVSLNLSNYYWKGTVFSTNGFTLSRAYRTFDKSAMRLLAGFSEEISPHSAPNRNSDTQLNFQISR